LLTAKLYRISAVRLNIEQNNLSIAESFWVTTLTSMPCTTCMMGSKLLGYLDIQAAVALPCCKN
jgi:hypothetical protein